MKKITPLFEVLNQFLAAPKFNLIKCSLFLALLTISGSVFGQLNMSNGSYSLSGTQDFYDSGGAGSNYANDENKTYVITPTNAGEKVSFYLYTHNFEVNFLGVPKDFLYVYNGNSTSAPLVATITGNGGFNGNRFTSTAADGSLTFRFTSDFSVTRFGWTAKLSTTLVSGGGTCAAAAKLCPSPTLTFITDPLSAVPSGNNYGCITPLSAVRSPSWFYVKMATAGSADITLTGSADLDFDLWGPYATLAAANAACGSLPAPVDCGFATGMVENINIPITATAGQIYVLMISNFAGGFQTFTLNQTSGTGSVECTGLPGFCDITALTSSNITACNDNGTPPTGSDDYYTADIVVTFMNKPATGTLNLGGSVIGSYSIAVASATSPYTFTNVQLPANGAATNVSATFSAATTCTENLAMTAVANCAVAVLPVNLELTMTADQASRTPGQPLVYTVTLKNTGAATATNVSIKDNIPAGVNYSSHSASVGTYDPVSGIWQVPTIAGSNTTKTLTINVTVQ